MHRLNQSKNYQLKYISEIDGLRALAVLSVVLFHFFPNFLSNGYLGVDVFFVISGFLITSQLISFESNSIKSILLVFYTRRIARLFPALFLMLLLTYFCVSFFFLPNDIVNFENSLVSAYTFWSNIYFWRDGGYFGGDDQLKPLLHIWSLSVEEQFYLISPVTILLMVKLNVRFKNVLIVGVFAIVVFSFIFWKYLNYIGGQNPAFFLLPTRVWQFGLGALVAISYHSGGPDKKFVGENFRHLLLPIFLLLILIALFSQSSSDIHTILISVGALGFINFAANNSSIIATFFRSNLAVFIGKISYSLYLYHWPIAVSLNYYFIERVPLGYSLVGVLFSVILGWLSYSFIENRFRHNNNFLSTIAFLFFCIITSLLLFFVNFKDEKSSFSNILDHASGANYRCDVASYTHYGSSRACFLKSADVNQNTIVLLGNSHAQMYAPMLTDIDLGNRNILLVPLNGCLPTTSINLSINCIHMAQRNLSAVLADKTITTVLIATTWYSDKYVDQNGARYGLDKLHAEILDLIGSIRNSGKKPILFSPIPIPNENHASKLARKLHFNKITEQEALNMIKVPRSRFDKQFSNLNNDLIRQLGTSYIRIYDEICDETNCYFGRDNTFYFADDSHLSKHAVINFLNAKEQLRTVIGTIP